MTRIALWRRDDGVGLVELLVVTTIMGIIASVTVGAIIQSFSQQRSQLEYVETLNAVKLAFERTTREIRAADPLLSGDADAITMRIRRAGTCRDMAFALVDASGVGRLVTRDPVGTPDRTVVRGLLPPGAQPTFQYQDESGAVMLPPLSAAQVGQVRVVTFSVRANVRNGPPAVLKDMILLRNRGGRQC